MKQQLYNHQELNQYLLGCLPEAETERLDELSVTDAEFADTLGASEKDLIDAYVQGELTGEVLQHFESRYLASPTRRAKVDFAQTFQALAAKDQAADVAVENPRESPTKRKARFPAFGIFRFPSLVTPWGLASATVALFLVGGWLFFENSGTGRRQPSIAAFVLTPQTREAGQIPTLSIPAKTDQVAVELELEPNDYSAYRVELIDPSDNQTLWRGDQLTANATGNSRALRISLPARILKPQNYLLRVTGVSSSGAPEIVGDYPFKL